MAPTSSPKHPNESKPVYASPAEEVLAEAQSSREVVQDFVPLAESLEWELGQQYFRERGNKAFISDSMPIPFIINNDGTLSRNAAEVFFTSLVEADKENMLEPELFVLEIGFGVGLFARFFLDHFQALCVKHQKNYYDRLCYVAADRSERMLTDLLRHGILNKHPGRYVVRQLDAMKPQETLQGDLLFQEVKGKPFRAVFLNYLLDCLPAAVLEFKDERVRQLCVRTCVSRNIRLSDFTDLSIEQLRERAESTNPKARQELLEVYGLFASEYDYRPVDVKTILYGEFAHQYGRTRSKRLLANFGAMECLSRLLEFVADDGFILMNEYGHSQIGRDDEFEHQRFSYATAVGLNFPLLRAYFADSQKHQWLEPSGDEERGIHTRILSKKPSYETTVRFQKQFNKAALDELDEPIRKARALLQHGRMELASDYYFEGLRLQPKNWVLLNEIASFLTYQLKDSKRAIDMARLALELNPTCSAELWNTLGDALYWANRFGEAQSAYEQALSINENDVRALYGLAYVHAREHDYAGALAKVAQGLALDKGGYFRDRLLRAQADVLSLLAMRNQQEYLLLINLVSRTAKKDERTEGAAASETPSSDEPRIEPRNELRSETETRTSREPGPEPPVFPRS